MTNELVETYLFLIKTKYFINGMAACAVVGPFLTTLMYDNGDLNAMFDYRCAGGNGIALSIPLCLILLAMVIFECSRFYRRYRTEYQNVDNAELNEIPNVEGGNSLNNISPV